jgi:lysophospholipase L1-like esterase
MIFFFHTKFIQANLLSLIILLFSYSSNYSQSIKILPLGDSITNGRGPEPNSMRTGYRQPLWLLLESDRYSIDFIGSDSAGYAAIPKYDADNAGFGGYSIKQILNLIKTGRDIYGNRITNGPYFNTYTPDIVLLHIGTNDLDTTTTDLEDLLNYFDAYQDSTNKEIRIILARIINEVPYGINTTIYNQNLGKMAEERIKKGDKIKLVDMEIDAGFNYQIDTVLPYNNGDMYDQFHPNNSGYAKMASLFYDTLSALLNNIIPAELENFSSLTDNDKIVLTWNTTFEMSNYGFEIERSEQNVGWESIGFVAGAGNSRKKISYSYVDDSLQSTGIYNYRLKVIEINGYYKYSSWTSATINVITSTKNVANSPKVFNLEQNFPNPFNPTTLIKYTLPKVSRVNITVFNLLGQKVAALVNSVQNAGTYEKIWNAGNLSSGTYFYILNAVSINGQHEYNSSKKMILLK